jgi:hypothetical protein
VSVMRHTSSWVGAEGNALTASLRWSQVRQQEAILVAKVANVGRRNYGSPRTVTFSCFNLQQITGWWPGSCAMTTELWMRRISR